MTEIKEVNFIHPIYKPAKIEEADAVGWMAPSKNKDVQMVPFKFPDLGPDEVRINITHTSLCQTDIHEVEGELGDCKFPLVPGHEMVGTVAALGKNVKDLKIGDRVGYGFQADCCEKCEQCTSGNENACAEVPPEKFAAPFLHWGGYATAVQQNAKFAIKIPAEFPDDWAPCMMCAGVTVYMPIKRHCKPGQKVGIIGIGGLGHLAVQIAYKWGCHVTAFSTHSTIKKNLVIQCGAEEVLDGTCMKTLEDHKTQFDVIIDTCNPQEGNTLSKYVDLLKPFGKFVYLSTRKGIKIEDPQPLMMKHVQIVCSATGPRNCIREVMDFCLKNKVGPLVEHYKFEELDQAWKRLKDGVPLFRCVVSVKEFAEKYNLHKTQPNIQES
jgi:D-arabinose 1-dehydrogenase-like Zn-dependent alcohol dehydrogenase